MNAREPSSVHEIVNQVIDKEQQVFSVLKRNLFTEDIADQGFCKIWDLLSVMSVINSTPAAWRLLIRTANIAPVLSPLPNTPTILINDVPILDASSKHIYRPVSGKKQNTPTAKEKLSAKYHYLTIDWKRV